MNKILNRKIISIVSFALALVLFDCSTKEEKLKTVKIKIDALGCGKLIKLTQVYFDEIVLTETTLDSLKSTTLEFEIEKPTYAYLQIGNSYGELYLEAGYHLEVTADCTNEKKPFAFSGHGAVVNNYLSEVGFLTINFRRKQDKFFTELELQDFLKSYDSLKNEISIFHQQYIDSVSLPRNINPENPVNDKPAMSEHILSVMETKNKLLLLSLGVEYTFMQQNNSLVDQIYAAQNKEEITPFFFSEEMKRFNEVPFDTSLLNSGSGDYRSILYYSTNSKFMTTNFDARTWMSEQLPKMPKTSYEDIYNDDYSKEIKQYLLAKSIANSLSDQGLTNLIREIFTRYKKEFSDSPYLLDLQGKVDKWLVLDKGQPAPEIIGTTLKGDTLSLSSLKGNVVYIDVWATWCGPCVEEIPYAIKVQNNFREKDNIVFLNISTDKDMDAWNEKLSKNPEWKGTHINQQRKGNFKSIYDSYLITGIPRYILIDQEGKIVNSEANRPSSGKVEGEIEELLKKRSE